MPQPYLVPVSPRSSRSTQSSGLSGSTSTLTAFPFTVRAINPIAFPLVLRLLRTGAPLVHPYLDVPHEIFVAEWGLGASLAGIPPPQNEGIVTDMIHQLSRRQVSVPLLVEKLPAQLRRRAPSEHHWRRGGRHMPAGVVLLFCLLRRLRCAGRRVLAG